VDFVTTEAGWLGYLADVSGHGIKEGVLMGNLKIALRLGLFEGHSLPVILDKTNRVLPAVKETEMYATIAAVRRTGAALIEYSLAGHLPILHYHAATRLVSRCRMEQFPLGICACNYESATVACEAGDLFALLSDGVVETEDAVGSEFGLERIERLLTEHGSNSVKDVANAIMTELAAFGTRRDDQSLLLIRIK
jgi:serine phosphatase RsbU (regulator of sigma subunit)